MRSLVSIRREISNTWPAILRNAKLGCVPRLPKPSSIKLLGSGTKTKKGEKRGVYTAIIYMSPDREAMLPNDTRTCCGMAGDCTHICLGHSAGRLIMESARNSREWKTVLLFGNRSLWRELLDAEAASFARTAFSKDLTPAIRVDGSTDTGEGLRASHRAFMSGDEERIDVRWYDYTKIGSRVHQLGGNYHLTYSWSERSTRATALKFLNAGASVAVVFDTPIGSPLPTHWGGYPVMDGDLSDDRFNDAPGSVVGLRFKAARNGTLEQAGKFVVKAHGKHYR